MIEAIAKIGEIELNKIRTQGQNELDVFIDKFKYNDKKKQEVIILNGDLNDTKLILKDIEVEPYSFSDEWKYLYKQGSPNGTDFSITTRYNGVFDKFWKRFERNIVNSGFQLQLSPEFTEIIKKSFNYSISDNVLVTIKIDEKYLGEIFKHVTKFYDNLSKAFENVDGKESKDTKGISYVSNVVTEVFGGGMSTSFSFYTTDKPGFSYELLKENSVKMLPLSVHDAKNLIAGKNILDIKFTHTLAMQRFYLIPNFYYIENIKIIKIFNKLSQLHDLKSDKDEVIDKENLILNELSKTDDYVSFNLLFFQQENSALRIIKLIEDVLPSRIRIVLESIDKTNKKLFQYDLTNKYWDVVCFEQKILYNLFSDTNSNEKFFETLDAIFKNKYINFNFFINICLKKMRIALHASGMQKKLYRQTIECFIVYLLFEELDIFRSRDGKITNKNMNQGGIIMNNKYTKSFEAFFQSYANIFTKPEKKYLFSLGFLLSRVASKQRQNLGSSPIMNQLKGLKLRKKDIIRLKSSLEGKARDYEIDHGVFESVDNYYILTNKKIDDWNVTDDEINFFLSLGINMNRCIWEELRKHEEEIPEEIKELEAQ